MSVGGPHKQEANKFPASFRKRRDCVVLPLAVVLTVLWFHPCPARASTDSGLTFDPTPLQVPQVSKQEHRAAVASDLIQLRDLRGIQISPDGEWIAFVVSQVNIASKCYRTGLFIIRRDGSDLINLGTAGPAHWDFAGRGL